MKIDSRDLRRANLWGADLCASRGASGSLSVSTDPANCEGVGKYLSHEALGPYGEVVDLLAELKVLALDAPNPVWDAAWYATRNAALAAARHAVRAAARSAARDAAWTAAEGAALAAAWIVLLDTVWDASRDIACDATLATLVRDVISEEHFRTLMAPLEAARAVMREGTA